MSIQAQIKVDAINNRLDKIISNVNTVRGYINRVVYEQYQRAQIERWKSAGSGARDVTTSEGDRWPRLNPGYLKYKRARFAGAPYGGNQMLVATGRLLREAVVAKKRTLRYGIEVYVTTPYAKDVAAVRPFMTFSKKTRGKILDGIRKYIRDGKV